MVDILQAGTRAIIVPFARGGQTEQSQRAARLEALGLVSRIEERELTPERLVAAIDAAVDAPRPNPVNIDVDGARCSAALIGGWAAQGDP
jgi:predicted glycosyltransferase